MSIAEKLTQAKADLDAVYRAGKLTDTYYLSSSLNFSLMFYKTAFPEDYDLTIKTEAAPATLNSMFRVCTGLRKLTMDIPPDQAYDGSYFIMGSASGTSTLEELVLPDGIRFSNIVNFAQNSNRLRNITGSIDLSESTSNLGFYPCSGLVNISFTAGSIRLSINFARSSRLSTAAIASIIEGLANLTEQTTQTLTLHATTGAALTAEQKAAITAKNWTLAY